MESECLELMLLPYRLAITGLDNDAPIPAWATESAFFSITRTRRELSVVCEERSAPDGARCERGWRCLMVKGVLDFSLTGVLSSLARPLADAGVSLFALSTFETDYLLVRDADLAVAVSALVGAGHGVEAY